MTDYTVDPLSIEKIEEHARRVLADCPKLPNGAIDILAALRLPTVRTIHGAKVLRLSLVADDLLPGKLAQMWASDGRVAVTARTSLWNKAESCDADALKELRHAIWARALAFRRAHEICSYPRPATWRKRNPQIHRRRLPR